MTDSHPPQQDKLEAIDAEIIQIQRDLFRKAEGMCANELPAAEAEARAKIRTLRAKRRRAARVVEYLRAAASAQDAPGRANEGTDGR
jgi:hypothetical protein